MSSIDALNAPIAADAHNEQDLGPLAWVLDELRKSLDGAVKSLRRFIHDAELARESDLAALDASPLRIARQQLHQANGALEMVGMTSPALVLRSMEAAVQKFVQRPEMCTDDAAATLERASFALSEYLENVLAGKTVSPITLFPQYRDVQVLSGATRVHPADLWPVELRLREPELAVTAEPLEYGPTARARLDQAVLQIVKAGDVAAAGQMRDTCLGFAASQTDRHSRGFWKLSAGFFEAFQQGLFVPDVYVKRVASRVLMQYATMTKGETEIADRLVQDLLFFCSQARQPETGQAPALEAVRKTFALERFAPVDYEARRFGRFDPAVLAQARKRIATATETWSALAGGDRNKLKPAADQFSLVCDSLRKLHRNSESLALALSKAVELTVRSGEPPSAALAMEVATAVLYLQAVLEELDTSDEQMTSRAQRLAERLDNVCSGADSEPLELWMEDLYRRVSDHQTMGSVVSELRATLGEAERAMDQFFRSPEDTTLLAVVPGQLAQMRGVLSVLGLDQASLAVVRMRDMVERLLIGEVSDEAERHQIFEKIANSLGALGFLIDMLSYQRALARKLFVYDEELGELRALMGRAKAPANTDDSDALDDSEEHVDYSDTVIDESMLDPVPSTTPSPQVLAPAAPLLTVDFDLLAPNPAEAAATTEAPAALDFELPAAEPVVAAVPTPAPVPVLHVREPEVDDELLEIFLEEVCEVVTNGLAAIEALKDEPGELSEQTSLRRAFHTLKGSSRMVGLNEFGEAGWSLEQLLNAWLAEQKPVHTPLLQLAERAMTGFGQWADAIASGNADVWRAEPFSRAADAMRLHGIELPLEFPSTTTKAPAPEQTPAPAPEPAPHFDTFSADMALQDATTTPMSSTPEDLDLAMDLLPELPDLPEVPEASETPQTLEADSLPNIFDFDVPPITDSAKALDVDAIALPDDLANAAEAAAAAAAAAAEDEAIAQAMIAAEAARLAEVAEAARIAEAERIAAEAEAAERAEAARIAEEAKAAEAAHIAAQAEAARIAAAAEEAEALRIAEAVEAARRAEAARVLAAAETARALEAARIAAAVEAAQAAEAARLAEAQEAARIAEAEAEAARIAEADRLAQAAAEEAAAAQAAQAAQEAETAAIEAARAQALEQEKKAKTEADENSDDAIKVIGSLRIGIPLYNVYLNEADEWSRRLATSLQEWSLELHRPLPDTAVALAHSMAGSSATVGFTALSETARLLEHALNHAQLQPKGLPEQAAVFIAAAEDMRRLLHQFAAGFLKESNPLVLENLREILQTEISTTVSPSLDDLDRYSYSDSDDGNINTIVDNGSGEADDGDPFDFDFDALLNAEETALLQAPGPVEPPPAPAPVQDSAPSTLTAAVIAAAPATPIAPAAPATAAVENIDDDIDVFDVLDPDLFPFFEEEAIELLPRLGGAIRQWVARPENLGARNEVLRALHTLKGSARLAGAMRLGEMSHRLESTIEQFDAEAVTSAQLEPLLGSFDDLQSDFDTLRAVSAQALTEPVVVQPPVAAAAAAVAAANGSRSQAQADAETVPVASAAPPAPAVAAPLRAQASQSVRVRAQLLDRLINQAGEVMITRSRMEARLGQIKTSMDDLTNNLERLRHQLRDIEMQSESQMQSRLALSKDTAVGFDPLEFDRFTRVQELTRMMAESVNDVATVQRNLQRAMDGNEDDLIAQARQARELQRDLLHTRMVEFEGISERLYAVVRQTSKELGKQVKLDITGGSIEMDRGVLDRMTPAFEHLLRNCVSHGIESPPERQAAGKPAAGTITIALRHEGNDVSVEFQDDGAGLNVERIRAKALAQGMIAPDAHITDTDAADLIFMPGFTTAATVTGLSGRGVGMDVVRSEINSLGGRIETESKEGHGMTFRMVLPLTTAVTQVVMLRAGELSIGVPANLVEVVRRVPQADLAQAYSSGQFDIGGGVLVPFYWSGGLLQASLSSQESIGKTRPVVVLRSASQRIAMHIDEVLGNQEVVVKNLGPQLSRLPGLAGMSVLASGAVVLIYNPVALSTVYGDKVRQAGKEAMEIAAAAAAAAQAQAAATPAQHSGPAVRLPGQVPLVLVVDDSITVRRVTQRLLQREGYRVALAADGLLALERLQEERPTVVLSDIEMPRMDGFDLARNIRADARLEGLPIIMITSRIAEKHRQHAMELGANHYLGKPYSDEELLSLIRHYAELENAQLEA